MPVVGQQRRGHPDDGDAKAFPDHREQRGAAPVEAQDRRRRPAPSQAQHDMGMHLRAGAAIAHNDNG